LVAKDGYRLEFEAPAVFLSLISLMLLAGLRMLVVDCWRRRGGPAACCARLGWLDLMASPSLYPHPPLSSRGGEGGEARGAMSSLLLFGFGGRSTASDLTTRSILARTLRRWVGTLCRLVWGAGSSCGLLLSSAWCGGGCGSHQRLCRRGAWREKRLLLASSTIGSGTVLTAAVVFSPCHATRV